MDLGREKGHEQRCMNTLGCSTTGPGLCQLARCASFGVSIHFSGLRRGFPESLTVKAADYNILKRLRHPR
jgi:hypothetical protein